MGTGPGGGAERVMAPGIGGAVGAGEHGVWWGSRGLQVVVKQGSSTFLNVQVRLE